MNWLMSLDPILLAAVAAGVAGLLLLGLGWWGRQVSRAECCRRCGHETAARVDVCPECGTSLRRSSVLIAYEMNHPWLARFDAVTVHGCRAPVFGMVVAGGVLLAAGLLTGGVLGAAHAVNFNWYSVWSTPTLLTWVESVEAGSVARKRLIAELERRRLDAPGDVALRDAVAALTAIEQFNDFALAESRRGRTPAIDAPPVNLGSPTIRLRSHDRDEPPAGLERFVPAAEQLAAVTTAIRATTSDGLPDRDTLATLLSGPGAEAVGYAEPTEYLERLDRLIVDLPAGIGQGLRLRPTDDSGARVLDSRPTRSGLMSGTLPVAALPSSAVPGAVLPGVGATAASPVAMTAFSPTPFSLGATRVSSPLTSQPLGTRLDGTLRISGPSPIQGSGWRQ